MKILDATWFSGSLGCIGIVAIESEPTGERKFYVGAVAGINETVDANNIAYHGAPLDAEALHGFLAKHQRADKPASGG